MKLHTAKSWDEMLRRILQSWADTASHIAPLTEASDDCLFESCERDRILHLAIASDRTVEQWPHWMGHELSYLLVQLKLAIQDQARDRPHYGSTVFTYFLGSGNIPPRDRSPEVREAVEIMDLNTKLYYLWIQNEVRDLGEWPHKVYQRLRVSDARHG